MNPREVLGVGDDATPEVIKAAYRKAAMKHHPDRNGGSAESAQKFQEIQEAYEALTKPAQQQQSQNPFQDFWGFDFGSFHQQRPRANHNYQTEAYIGLEQAYQGTELSVTIGDRILTVKIPAGTRHGEQIVISGEGGRDIADLPPGDLIVIVVFQQHERFKFSGGFDLHVLENIDVIDLMLGCVIPLTVISGDVISVTIPAGSSHTTRLRIAGKGMPTPHNGHGDLYIQIVPEIPMLTDEQKDVLRTVRS